jgi:hypothetical protein
VRAATTGHCRRREVHLPRCAILLLPLRHGVRACPFPRQQQKHLACYWGLCAVCVMSVVCVVSQSGGVVYIVIMAAPLRQASSSSLRWTPWAYTRATSTRPKLVRPPFMLRQPPPNARLGRLCPRPRPRPLAFGLLPAHHRGGGR